MENRLTQHSALPAPNPESTPEFVVRQRRRRPLTLTDKLLLSHLSDPEGSIPEPGRGYLQLSPDRIVLQDVLGQTAMLQFAQCGRAQVARRTSIHCDHLIVARAGADADLRQSLSDNLMFR
jgi:aconitate hydratase A / 2-methylisocitrate dehydratase